MQSAATKLSADDEDILDQLIERIKTSNDPPIAEIEGVLKKYLSAKTLPADKPSPSDQDRRAVDAAVFALQVITSCERHLLDHDKLDSCLLGAWPGIWSWLKFLDEQCCQRLKNRYGSAERIQAMVFIPSALEKMSHSHAVRSKLVSTRGVVAMITRHWNDEGRYPADEKIFADAGVPRPFTAALDNLLDSPALVPKILPDLIAVCGSAKAVAIKAVGNLDGVLADKPPHFASICSHISLVQNLSCLSAPKILLAMLGQGMIYSSVKLLLWLHKQARGTPFEEHMASKAVLTGVGTLLTSLMSPNGPSWAIQALDAGVLPVALKLCMPILLDVLRQYLMYKAVVRSAARALRRMERLIPDDGLGGPIQEAWIAFKTLAEERIAQKERVDKEEAKPHNCDRVNCDALIDHDDLLRCSGCSQVFYCDSACQRMDWPTHKSTCQEARKGLREGIETPISSSDSRFICEIVENDIHKNNEVVMKLLSARHASSSPSDFTFILDYTEVPVDIRLSAVDKLHRGVDHPWDALIERAKQSNGRLIMARAEIQRGGFFDSVAYLIPTPTKKN